VEALGATLTDAEGTVAGVCGSGSPPQAAKTDAKSTSETRRF
jgi:hypothetical protein